MTRKWIFLMLLLTLGASVLGNMFTEKRATRARNWVAWAGNGVVRSEIGYNNVEHMDESF